MSLKTIVLILTCFIFFNIGHLSAQTRTSNGLNTYSLDLYQNAKVNNENLLLSPISTYYALLMAYDGSKNKTKAAFEKVLHLQKSDVAENDYLKGFLAKTDSSAAFKVSNAIWLDNRMRVKNGFRKAVSDKYSSDFKRTDFTDVGSAVLAINGWVDKKTNHKIGEIISADDVTPSTRLLLLNAVYFKGKWLNKFSKSQTSAATFFADVKSQYKVGFMKMTENLAYFENGDYQFVSKPYQNSDLSFCVILPKKLFGIEEIEQKMDNVFFKSILDSAKVANTQLFIPKIKLESSVELSNVLKKAGLTPAFSEHADFSGITETPLALDKVIHKTFIELDEEKTESAAATAVTVRITGLPSYKIFKADHPFLFFIIDNKSKAILFIGRYAKPTNGEKMETENLASNLERKKTEKFSTGNLHNSALFVLDGNIISEAEFNGLSAENIEAVHVYKDKSEIAKYSPKDYDGLVVITLKKGKKLLKTD
ncbi:serpin B [Pedobacter sp. UYP30]|uniref:serpin family protein n=1 Tax=Pedobacter sp. UYP30 TaxID=1756400 RepID=UPI003397BF5A